MPHKAGIVHRLWSSLANSATRGLQSRMISVCFISWAEVAKVVPNQGLVCFVSYGRFLCCVSGVCSVLFHCFWLSVPDYLPGKTRDKNGLLCVE